MFIYDPTPGEELEWKQWVASRPAAVRQSAEKFVPWELYRLKPTGQRVVIRSIFEDGTISVDVPSRYNSVPCNLIVFGINPDDLEACSHVSKAA